MSINNVNNAGKAQLDAQKLTQQQLQNSGGTNVQKSSTAGPAPSSDAVSLTQSAQQLAGIQKKGASEAPVNLEKVERLKKAIADGEYKVNPEALAKKIAVLESQILGIRN